MTAQITSGQKNRIKDFVGSGLDSLKLTKDQAQRVISRGGELQKRINQILFELVREFFVLLTDGEAVAWLVRWAGKSDMDAQKLVQVWRTQARARGVADDVRIHAQVLAGCTLKQGIPLMGPCYEKFQYLQGWDFPDPPTEHCLVSWIPVPLAGSINQDVAKQAATLAAFKTEALLPAGYNVSFGSVVHVGGMALAHHRAVGSDPFAGLVVRTDTCFADGDRLELYWRAACLLCDYWDDDDDRRSVLAAFALGVIKALEH